MLKIVSDINTDAFELEAHAAIRMFSPLESDLVAKHELIFDNPEAPDCPECHRNKSPLDTVGPCLQCVEGAIQARRSTTTGHLPKLWPADAHMIAMSHRLIAENDMAADGAEIAFVMRGKHGEANGKVVLGSCAKQSARNRMLIGFDFVIEIAWDFWAAFTDTQRDALLHHELSHIGTSENGGWCMVAHSVEEHVATIERYGLWKPDLKAFAEAIGRICRDDGSQLEMFED